MPDSAPIGEDHHEDDIKLANKKMQKGCPPPSCKKLGNSEETAHNVSDVSVCGPTPTVSFSSTASATAEPSTTTTLMPCTMMNSTRASPSPWAAASCSIKI